METKKNTDDNNGKSEREKNADLTKVRRTPVREEVRKFNKDQQDIVKVKINKGYLHKI